MDQIYKVRVVGWRSCKGRDSDRMGSLKTPMGWVGLGFTEDQRHLFTIDFVKGKVIEVACNDFDSHGNFRNAVFMSICDG